MTRALIIFFAFLLFPFFSFANNVSVVSINEIAWMGTLSSANDEWIELTNNTDSEINVDKWILKSSDEKIKISLAGKLPAKQNYLLERTDDDSVQGIKADLIYSGVMSNSGMILELYDNYGNLIDRINCETGWVAGNNETKQTMEKIYEKWQTSSVAEGTPKAPNGEKSTTVSVSEKSLTINNQNKKNSVEFDIRKITLTELMPSPEGADKDNEWVELFNFNDIAVSLSNWKIRDIEGAILTYVFPPETKIAPNEYLIFKRTETKISLNNDGDGLELISPDGKITDSVLYGKAVNGQSYSKINSEWIWSNILTPGKPNAGNFSEKTLPEQDKSDNEINITSSMADKIENNEDPLKKIGTNGSNPVILFFSAIILSAVLAALILIIKLKIIKRNVRTQSF